MCSYSRTWDGTWATVSTELRAARWARIWKRRVYTYPDATIICGAIKLDKQQATSNPKVLFEILSPTTRRYDRVGKFEHYRQIPSLEEYVLVEQSSYSIDRHRRLADDQWELTRFQGEAAILELVSVNVTVPLKQSYANVPFELAEREAERPR